MTATGSLSHTDVHAARGLRTVSRLTSAGVAFIGAFALAASVLEIRQLKEALHPWGTMAPVTAFAIFLGGASQRLLVDARLASASLASRRGRMRLAAKAAAWIVVMVGLLGVGGFFLECYVAGGVQDVQSEVGLSLPLTAQPAPVSALCLLMTGTALIFFGTVHSRASQLLALTTGIVGLLQVIGLTYGAESLYYYGTAHHMCLLAAIAFVGLSVSILCARTSDGFMEIVTADSLGGLVVRRMLPAAIAISLLAGFLQLNAERAGYIGMTTGVTILTLTNVITFVCLTWWTARLLHATDVERKSAENAVRNAHNDLEKRVEDRTAELAHLVEETNEAREQLRALAAHNETVREDERTRIAREIHDELGQQLTALKMDLAWLERKAVGETECIWSEKIGSMTGLVDQTIRTVRRIATELRPSVLDDLGLVAAMDWQAQDFQNRTGIQCERCLPESDIPLDFDRATAVFRIFQETLTNVARHSRAKKVEVHLFASPEDVQLRVTDNGRGITLGEQNNLNSLGILGMRERAQQYGGDLQIVGFRGRGTTVTVCMPLATAPSDDPPCEDR